ncbi:MAG: hypothetical protein ABI002_02060 [Saprospiraceae bacterium]
MINNLILGLAVLAYILLLPFSLNRAGGTGDQNVGYLIGFYILIAFVVLSLILTLIVAANGGFNWISHSTLWRNIGIGVLWLGMIAGIVTCSMIKADISFGDKSTGLERIFALLVYNGGVWLPLLMLIPYSSYLNPDWRFALDPNVAKIPLLLGCAFGIISSVMPIKLRTMIGANSEEYKYNQSMTKINEARSLTQLLNIASDKNDERLRDTVYTKIVEYKNLEDELLMVLEENNPYVFISVYEFWEKYSIEHPARFIDAINLNLTMIDSKYKVTMGTPWEREGGFESIDIGTICRVLSEHFKESSDQFRPNMLMLQQTLESTPAKRESNNEQFMVYLNKYRLEVKSWLDTNR